MRTDPMQLLIYGFVIIFSLYAFVNVFNPEITVITKPYDVQQEELEIRQYYENKISELQNKLNFAEKPLIDVSGILAIIVIVAFITAIIILSYFTFWKPKQLEEQREHEIELAKIKKGRKRRK